MKRLLTIVLVLVAVGAGAAAYYMRDNRPEPTVSTMPVTRGDVVDVVAATGTLEAVTTVDVGTQVSGLVQDMYADFNSIVKKGQIIARLDPSLIQTQIEQRSASVIRAEADLERLKVNLADARRKLDQAKAMWDRQLIPRDQLETAELNVRTLESQIKSSEAGLVQAQADLNSQKVNLGHTVIKSPIDGIVISRNVDPGQTVAASMNAPVLYQIAEDLNKMQVLANIDEADVGRMRPGQNVTFRVDAYPTDRFSGTVQQVRLQPTVVQNVVVYSTVISVPNPQLKLKPGMTANVEIEVARKSNVLRLPAAATRFRPTEEMFVVLAQEVPPEARPGGGRSMGRGGARGAPDGGRAGASQPAEAATAPQSGAASRASGREAAGGGRGSLDPNTTPDERRRRFEERMANMSPEERERFQRMREQRAQGGNQTGERSTQGFGRRDMSRGIAGGVSGGSAVESGATTIDALFAPLPTVESRGRVWLYIDKQLKPISVRLGISDGTFTELLSGDLNEGQEVVVNMVTGLEQRTTTPNQGQSGNPLMGPQRGPQRGGRGR
ncbi:MAG TPA: efflux RND transporter periplasmic adaptor subunit [Vicinamibacterales bacterium]|nr:efflux RND transporter periplasmic adaptor subunit [Vicinamibacterales bacterium]